MQGFPKDKSDIDRLTGNLPAHVAGDDGERRFVRRTSGRNQILPTVTTIVAAIAAAKVRQEGRFKMRVSSVR